METNEKKGCADFAEVARIIEQNREELLEALSSAVRIQSDQAEPVTAEDGSVYPFGAGVQQVHEAVLAMGREMGFEAVDIDHYGGCRRRAAGTLTLTAEKSETAIFTDAARRMIRGRCLLACTR